jgi:DHA2 family multidrug resistance protein
VTGPGSASIPAVANRGLITASVMAATFMQALDTTIANVALPRMQGSLSATQDQITWVLTSYIVSAAIMIPLTGWLASRFGRKHVFLISVALFTVASALCGAAETLPQMVLFRLLQGIGGAALVPLSQAVLLDINPPARHGQAMAVWGAGVTLGPVLGPVLGGWLTDDYSWRWVFYINVPIGLLAFLGILIFSAESEHQARRFDFFGFALLSVGVGALQLMLDRGELKDWFGSTEIWIEATVAGLAFYLFIVHSATAEHPFLDPALFRDRNFVTGNVFIFIVGIVLFATLALLPPLLENLLNYPVMTSGMVMAPRGIGSMISMFVVGRLVGRVDARFIIAAGFGLTIYSLWQMTQFSLLMDEGPIVWSALINGFGIGLAYVPLSTVAFATLARQLRTEGAAFFNLLRNLGSSIGISAVQALLTSNAQVVHSSLAEHVTAFNPLARAPYLADRFALTTQSGLAALNAEVSRQASMIAFIDDFKLMMVISVLSLPLLLLIRGSRPRPAKPEEMSVALE